MNEQITQLLERYKDGVPVKIETGTIVSLSAAAILTVMICAVIVKYVKQL